MNAPLLSHRFRRGAFAGEEVGIQLWNPRISGRYNSTGAQRTARAFYRIWIEAAAGTFTVHKESGIRDRVLDKRAWPFDSLDNARKLFGWRIKSKTNPERKSPRVYTLVYNI